MPRTRRKLHERQSRSIGQDCPHQRKLRKKQDRLSHKRDRTRLEKEIDNQNITIDNSTYRKTYLTSGEDRFSNWKNTNSEIHTDNVKGPNWCTYDDTAELTTICDSKIPTEFVNRMQNIEVYWSNFDRIQQLEVFQQSSHSFYNYVQQLTKDEKLNRSEFIILCWEKYSLPKFKPVPNSDLDEQYWSPEIVIKRIGRRGNDKCFVSHRNHKEKYAF